MIHRMLTIFVVLAFLAGCTTQPVRVEPSVTLGDVSGYVSVVAIKHKDLKNVCNFEIFQEGFRYTYMSMWNSRIDKILESQLKPDVAAYYTKKFFYAKPNVKATLDTGPSARDRHGECQEASYQLGTINGFIYSLENLERLEQGAPE